MFSGIDIDYRKATIFQGNSTLTLSNPVVYQVPYGARLLYFFGGGAGGGGGGGASGPEGTTRGGGSGASASQIIDGFIPTQLIPSTLLLQVGKGGAGGGPDENGVEPGQTRILMPQRTTSSATVFQTLVNLGIANPGQAGTSLAGGAGANFSLFACEYPAFAIPNPQGGGGSGGAATGGAGSGSGSATSITSFPTPGGGVGTNNVSFAGGNSTTVRLSISGGTAGAGFNGSPGFASDPLDFTQPFVRNGPTGGASNGTGTGGNGGDAALGCAGAGGGGGVVGGRGGNGGDGFIIMIPIF